MRKHMRFLIHVWARVWFLLLNYSAFRKLGRSAFIASPYRLDGAESIEIGERTFMQRGMWLYCGQIEDATIPKLVVGKHCVFGYNNHITCVGSLEIGDKVLTANNVYISDNVHDYEDIHCPIVDQPIVFKGPVVIGDGCWLGENVAIIAASVGKNCVIGANAVVVHDIPDYSVAVGIPAVVIRRFDIEKQEWVSVSKK